MLDPFVLLAPLLILPVVGLMRFIGCVGADPVLIGEHSVVVVPPSITLMPGEPKQFAALVDGVPSEKVSWSPPTAPKGLYTAPNPFVPGSSAQISATSDDYPGTDPGTANVTLIGNGAKFLPADTDTMTQGIWKNKYGKDGWALAYLPSSLVSPPVYLPALFASVAGLHVFSLTDPIMDPRGLLNPTTFANFAASWADAKSLELDFHFSDFQPHQVAIYSVDWDTVPVAVQTFTFSETSSGSTVKLDTRTLSKFGGGQYLVWQLTGNVHLSVTSNGAFAVMSGIFFD